MCTKFPIMWKNSFGHGKRIFNVENCLFGIVSLKTIFSLPSIFLFYLRFIRLWTWKCCLPEFREVLSCCLFVPFFLLERKAASKNMKILIEPRPKPNIYPLPCKTFCFLTAYREKDACIAELTHINRIEFKHSCTFKTRY